MPVRVWPPAPSFAHMGASCRITLAVLGLSNQKGLTRAMAEAEWSDFRIVLALGRGGSIAGAARLMGVDNSTVSRRLAAVESALGACLIVRGGGEFAFTAEGKAALIGAKAMEFSATSIASSIRAAKTELEGPVRISCVPSMLRILMPFQALVSEKHPKLFVELDSAVRVVDLAKGEADISVRMTQPAEIDVIPISSFEWGAAAFGSKTYLERHGYPKSVDDLKAHKLVQYVETMLHLPLYNWMEKHANKNTPSMRVENTEMAFGMIMQGAGIGVISCFYGDESADIVRVFPEPVFSTTGWIVVHESSRGSARTRVVVDALAAYLAERKSSLSGRPAENRKPALAGFL